MQTFARWVLTPENRSARLAVGQVTEGVAANRPRRDANPLFLHGPSGTGKTHLVTALAHELSQRQPQFILHTVAARDLASQIAAKSICQPDNLTDCDLLTLEDLQHLPARAAEMLVGVLDARLAQRRQTVCTANVGPAQLMQLPTRLTSRLAAGLVVGLAPLGPASRQAFLQDRAQRRQLPLSKEVLTWLAEHLAGSARQLEGAIARLETLANVHGRIPDLAAVARHFQIEVETSRPTVEQIAERVGRYFRVDPRLLQSRRRSRGVLQPRQVAMALTRRLTGLSLEEIGAYFGGRDHSTVLHACRKIDAGGDTELAGAVRQLQAELV